MRWSLHCIVFLLIISLVFAVDSVAKTAGVIPGDWKEHLDIIVPGITMMFKAALWIITSLLSFLGVCFYVVVKWYVNGRRKEHAEIITNQTHMNDKLDDMCFVMRSCNGCKDTAEDLGIILCRRREDLRTDSSDLL